MYNLRLVVHSQRSAASYCALGFVVCAQLFLLVSLQGWFVLDVGTTRVSAVADDVYITANYARTLAEGFGPFWYRGAPAVEGFSNPLWMLLIASFHRIPGFHEKDLGAYLLLLNCAIVVALLVSAWRVVGRGAFETVLVALNVSILIWMSEGFSVGLLALLALAAFEFARSDEVGVGRSVAIGVMAALAFWTRMDAVIYFLAAGSLLATGPRPMRSLASAAAAAVPICATLFAWRLHFFGEWLPNTYYLKMTGWPLAERIARGVDQNASLYVSGVLGGVVLLWLLQSKRVGKESRSIFAAFATFWASVAYSTWIGGDSWGLKAGGDRFTAPGLLFLLLAMALSIRSWRIEPRWRQVAPAIALLVGLSPMLLSTRTLPLLRERVIERSAVNLVGAWIRQGVLFGEISKPGARIALCAAGAIPYFSRRGGVDLLGKNDPYIARLPVPADPPKPSLCWTRDRPGHNKLDASASFALRRPDLSLYRPPVEVARDYHRVRFRGVYFWVRHDTPYVRAAAGLERSQE